ncbi:hypothetical protein VTK73DRAFT_3597 [Phialemonium thermophilum]|uniref:Uncharacterized protein n=1 Tax=Phialemonium thermophilum TaxID=223376 RepID=A0ABR3VGS3_9PEZI
MVVVDDDATQELKVKTVNVRMDVPACQHVSLDRPSFSRCAWPSFFSALTTPSGSTRAVLQRRGAHHLAARWARRGAAVALPTGDPDHHIRRSSLARRVGGRRRRLDARQHVVSHHPRRLPEAPLGAVGHHALWVRLVQVSLSLSVCVFVCLCVCFVCMCVCVSGISQVPARLRARPLDGVHLLVRRDGPGRIDHLLEAGLVEDLPRLVHRRQTGSQHGDPVVVERLLVLLRLLLLLLGRMVVRVGGGSRAHHLDGGGHGSVHAHEALFEAGDQLVAEARLGLVESLELVEVDADVLQVCL